MDTKHSYESDVVLGESYQDKQTGIEGVATSVTFFQHACERVALELVVEGKIEEYVFDAPRLVGPSGHEVTAKEPGGPDRGSSHKQRGPLGR